MVQNFCVRITISGLLMTGSIALLGCSSSERQTSQTADSSAPQATASYSDDPHPTEPSATAVESRQSSGMKMFIDPKTGEMRDPTAEELAELAKQQPARKASQAAVPIQMPDGTIMVPADNKQIPMQGCIDGSGNLRLDHECAAPGKRSEENQK